MPVAELAIPGAHNVSNALAAVAVGPAVRRRARRDPPRGDGVHAASSTASSRSRWSTASASSTTRRAPSRTRSSPRCGRSTRPIVLIAGGRDKGVDLSALAPVVAERAAAGPHRRERPGSSRPQFRAAGLARTERAPDLEAAVPRADALAREARAASADVTGDRAAQPGRRELRHVRRLRRPRAGVQGRRRGPVRGPPRRRGQVNLDPPIPRLERLRPGGLGGPGRPPRRPMIPSVRSTGRPPTGRRSRAGPGRSSASATSRTTSSSWRSSRWPRSAS